MNPRLQPEIIGSRGESFEATGSAEAEAASAQDGPSSARATSDEEESIRVDVTHLLLDVARAMDIERPADATAF